MKDKTIAAILSFFGGIIGLQRFYLGQTGLGAAHLFFFILVLSAGPNPFTIMVLSLALIFGFIDAISFLSMDAREFDLKYNAALATQRSAAAADDRRRPGGDNPRSTSMTDRERRFRERQRQRAARERERELRDKQRYNQRIDPTTAAERTPAPQTPSRTTVARRDPGRAHRERGVYYFKDFEYDRAIQSFGKALEKNPQDVASHFNIACAYSLQEETDRAFFHLDRAVALGFDDFNRIRNHDSLAYLRIQPEYATFQKNNFRLTTTEPASPAESPSAATGSSDEHIPAPSDDLLDQLQRLAALREKGLLTEREFDVQKRRLLG